MNRRIGALAPCVALVCLGCAAQTGTSIGELDSRDVEDCRADDSCGDGWGPAEPVDPTTPADDPPPLEVPDCRGATFPSYPSRQPYATDQADWLRAAHRYASAQGAAAGYVNFHAANYGRGSVRGTILLGTAAVAMWRDVRPGALGNPRLEDVRAMMRGAQNYARLSGYDAALPTFEQGLDASGQVVYGISLLSPAAVDVRLVDGCELGSPDWLDVEGVFRGAHDYATREGYVGGIPTFEVLHPGNGRVLFYVILVRAAAEWSDVRETAISPFCGRDGMRACGGYWFGCEPGFDFEQWDPFSDGRCVPREEPPPCGDRGEICCAGGHCDDPRLSCQYLGLFHPSVCQVEQPPVERCGDGQCSSSELCWCDDCRDTAFCRPACEEGELTPHDFCVVCSDEIIGDWKFPLTIPACDEEAARREAERQYSNCEVNDGSC